MGDTSPPPDQAVDAERLARELLPAERTIAVAGVTWAKGGDGPTLFDEVLGVVVAAGVAEVFNLVASGATAPFTAALGHRAKTHHSGLVAMTESACHFVDLRPDGARVFTFSVHHRLISVHAVVGDECALSLNFGRAKSLQVKANEAFGARNAACALHIVALLTEVERLDGTGNFTAANWQAAIAKIAADPPTLQREREKDLLAAHLKRVRVQTLECRRCASAGSWEVIPYDLYAAKGGRMPEATGMICRSCHAALCSSCMKAHGVKRHWWSGYEKTACSECGKPFGPAGAFFPPGLAKKLLWP
jgi:hypothetical protein